VKVFMLGWEFPPFISGGLGVACFGLAKALNHLDVDVLFVLPKPTAARVDQPARPVSTRQIPKLTNGEVEQAVAHAVEQAYAHEATDHFREPEEQVGDDESLPGDVAGEQVEVRENTSSAVAGELAHVRFRPVDVLLSPYLTVRQYEWVREEQMLEQRWPAGIPRPPLVGPPSRGDSAPPPPPSLSAREQWMQRAVATGGAGGEKAPAREQMYLEQMPAAEAQYATDLFAETQRYAQLALGVAKKEDFDVVHAHDWMTFPAAMAVADATGKPLVVQIHSTELDRAGANAHPRIMEIEREGMLAAERVVAVSYLTKTQLIEKYGVDPRKIRVVYNAPQDNGSAAATASRGKKAQRIVLFLGRITQQKGPDYFLHAARKVLEKDKHVKFVMAGGGDMAEEIMAAAEEMGISSHVVFTGFLRKREVEKVFKLADVYVMPSVSEPFGQAPLEALSNDVPVIISKQSGVAEVLKHVLKVDFWDTEDLANKILAVLRHPPLAETLREEGKSEVRLLSWEDSARRVVEVYEELTSDLSTSGVGGK